MLGFRLFVVVSVYVNVCIYVCVLCLTGSSILNRHTVNPEPCDATATGTETPVIFMAFNKIKNEENKEGSVEQPPAAPENQEVNTMLECEGIPPRSSPVLGGALPSDSR